MDTEPGVGLKPDAYRTRWLLEGEAGGCAAGAGDVVADYAGLVGAEHALAGAADGDWGSGDGVADRGGVAVAGPREEVAALCAGCQDLVEQARLCGGGGAGSCAA